MIKLQVIGNLGKDCLVNLVGGKNVINFNVAHTEKYRDSTGVQKEKTIWVECAYWTDRTGLAPYLKKGQQVFVEGAPELRTFTRNDGTTGSSLSLRVQYVQLLGAREMQQGGENHPVEKKEEAFSSNSGLSEHSSPLADDLPF